MEPEDTLKIVNFSKKNSAGLDTEKFYYYVGESQGADKRMTCEKANADAIDDIAKLRAPRERRPLL